MLISIVHGFAYTCDNSIVLASCFLFSVLCAFTILCMSTLPCQHTSTIIRTCHNYNLLQLEMLTHAQTVLR